MTLMEPSVRFQLMCIILYIVVVVFAEDSRVVTVEEPESGVTTVILNVTREGGTLGLSFVDYNVTSANGKYPNNRQCCIWSNR